MTTPSQIATEISRVTYGLAEAGYLLGFNATKVREKAGFREAIWATGPPEAAGKLVGTPHTVREYLDALQSGQYTMLFLDGAFLQLRYRFVRRRMIQHSLCYYPCPISLEAAIERLDAREVSESDDTDTDRGPAPDVKSYLDERVDEGFDLATIIELGLLDDDLLRLRGPIRFDYDLRAAADDHPGSHVHLSSGSCRLPVFGALSPGAFLKFVVREYYPEIWASASIVRDMPVQRIDESIEDVHRRRLHVQLLFDN